jgi:Rrf2 family transcriptional regulator, nitric oxide-sensitive transcriptional repressor
MRLTTLSDYALRLLMHVARHPDRLCTIAEVAAHHGVSEAHLMKVTHRLAQGGFLRTVRGQGGGMRLARPADAIRIGDVVRHTEADLALVECFATGSRCTLTGDCRLADVLRQASDAFMSVLDATTLADVLPTAPDTPVDTTIPVTVPSRRTGTEAVR